jgi:hypothetical protein
VRFEADLEHGSSCFPAIWLVSHSFHPSLEGPEPPCRAPNLSPEPSPKEPAFVGECGNRDDFFALNVPTSVSSKVQAASTASSQLGRRVSKERHARIESLRPQEAQPFLRLALQGAFSGAPYRRMNPESEFVDERRCEKGPSQLAAAVDQQIGRKLGLEFRDSVSCVAFEERRIPLERAFEACVTRRTSASG